MLQDLEARKPLEYEAFNGIVIRVLRQAGKRRRSTKPSTPYSSTWTENLARGRALNHVARQIHFAHRSSARSVLSERSCCCKASPTPKPWQMNRSPRANTSLLLAGGVRLPYRAEGTPHAGGRAFPIPFGTVYSTNITQDKETGLGDWTDPANSRCHDEGIRRDGSRILPVMPY